MSIRKWNHRPRQIPESEIPDPEVVGAMAEEANNWAKDHPDHTIDELMDWYRSKGWLDD